MHSARITDLNLIESGEHVALTDIVFTEILQGLRDDGEAAEVERHLRAFPILQLATLEDFSLATELYRAARGSGPTRPSGSAGIART